MTPQLWIGCAFASVLVLLLGTTLFIPNIHTRANYSVLKFLSALCGGMAGGFITGSSLFEGVWTSPSSKITISGALGFALFFVVWFFYPKPPERDPDSEGVEIDIPEKGRFRSVAEGIANIHGLSLDYQGFSDAELSASLMAGRQSSRTLEEAFRNLRLKSKTPGAIREYTVARSGSVYILKIR